MTLWVCASWARKSRTCAMSTAVLRPTDATSEKPTALAAAQSSIDDVSAPDCDTSASGPALASGPITLALSCNGGRWKPRLFGPSRLMPSRRAMRFSSAAFAGPMPLPTTSAERQAMRPASSSAAATSSCRQRDDGQVRARLREVAQRAAGVDVQEVELAGIALGAQRRMQRRRLRRLALRRRRIGRQRRRSTRAPAGKSGSVCPWSGSAPICVPPRAAGLPAINPRQPTVFAAVQS